LAFAAVGTGLIHLALVLGSPLWLAIPLAVFGFAEFGWGVITFARERPLVPRAAIVVALIPVLAWVVGLASASAIPEVANPSTLLPLGIASVFELFIAAMLGRMLRRDRAPVEKPSTQRYLLGVAAGALVTAALVVPALAAAQGPAYDGAGLDLPTHHGP
jgi:hypothetical protein